MLHIAIYLFNGITALDAVGPYESLSRSKQVQVTFVGRHAGPVRTGNGALALIADRSIADVGTADVLIMPGGNPDGLNQAYSDTELNAWIKKIDANSTLTCSVCTGALILGAAGLLAGRQASTHWRAQSGLAKFGATYSADRLTRDGKYVSSAGVSAGIDLGLAICGELLGTELAEAIELSMQYDPKPPFGTGNPEQHSTPERVHIIEKMLR